MRSPQSPTVPRRGLPAIGRAGRLRERGEPRKIPKREGTVQPGVIFDLDTGGNTLVGNVNVVVDNGDRDCDGDGRADPNIIGGRGAVVAGVDLGHIVSQAMSGTDASGFQ